MSTQRDLIEQSELALAPQPTTDEQRRLRRAAALKAAEGLWKNRDDIPKDGVEYQEYLRAEWP